MPQKANSTNILVQNSTFYNGDGMAMGSIGQFPGQYEIIENVTARDITTYRTEYAGYAKTWTGVEQGIPPNGGGGGLGLMKNITFTNFTVHDSYQLFSVTQCNSYIGATGGCDTSQYQIEDLTWGDMKGTVKTNVVASLQCSGSAPCTGVNISNVAFTVNGTVPATGFLCSNVTDPIGFTCNGLTAQT